MMVRQAKELVPRLETTLSEDFQMKISFISMIVALVVLVSFANPASADRIYEKNTNVVKVLVKNTKTGWHKTFKSDKPVTILRKTCADDHHRDCFFLVKGSKEMEIKYLRYTDSDKYTDGYDFQVVYVYQTAIQTY